MVHTLRRVLMLSMLLQISVQTATACEGEKSSTVLFPVSSENGAVSKVGFIDSKGRLVIDFSFYAADEFSEGLAQVTFVRDGKQGYIDTLGRTVIDPQFDWAFPFRESRAKVRINRKWGYIDRTGKIIIEAKFDEADSFYEGLARVNLAGRWGYIDKSGKLVIPFQFEGANRFSEGLACVVKNERLGYINKFGQWVIAPRFEPIPSPTEALFVSNFSEGLAVIKKGNQYGYINKVGAVVILAYFDRAEGFSEGLASISVGAKAGYINRSGALVIPPQFDAARRFSESLSEVEVGDKWGYIDHTGKVIIEPQFDTVLPFRHGLAQVGRGRTSGYINHEGEYIWKTNGAETKKYLPTLPAGQQRKAMVRRMARGNSSPKKNGMMKLVSITSALGTTRICKGVSLALTQATIKRGLTLAIPSRGMRTRMLITTRSDESTRTVRGFGRNSRTGSTDLGGKQMLRSRRKKMKTVRSLNNRNSRQRALSIIARPETSLGDGSILTT